MNSKLIEGQKEYYRLMSKVENHGESDHEEKRTSGGYKGVCDQMNEK